jgi:RimJ/RimL family protein N-acetyltransferase
MPLSEPVPPFSLAGRFVRLVPLEAHHVDALLEAATDDRSTFHYSPVPWDRPTMEDYVGHALERRAAREHYPFVTWSTELGRVVGSTRFYDLTAWDWVGFAPGSERFRRPGPVDVTNIGYTWLHPAVQRSAINTEAKLLMLTHAFERWGAHAVRLKTDARNERSRSAIARLGCTFDGVLRAERPATDGTVRDSAFYSMLASEWPPNRRRLLARLDR